jgi:rhamnulose-1-phosphate aldolase
MVSNPSQLDDLLRQMGEAGKRLSEIGAAEGAAGNLSICLRDRLDFADYFPRSRQIELSIPVPALAGATLLVTGSGCRLREIREAPAANLASIVVEAGGQTGQMFTAPDCPFERVTSEFNAHLAGHHDRMREGDIPLHAIIHAQPLYLTFLSHLPPYQDEGYLNDRLLRWQPESILNFPEGIGVLPFLLPGSQQLTVETRLGLRDHRMVVWCGHGVMARADGSMLHGLDLIEYAETAAHYEYLNLAIGSPGQGLAPEQIRAVAASWNVRQNRF